ncbi:MAG: hypothetical protein QE285_03040 [Aquabacterium sp.]|nr:hypothetical protein [Aquabacterium sp.]
MPTAVRGVMIDGYVSGATVFCDSNGNGSFDSGEVSATTDPVGAYELAAGCSSDLVGSGGTNTDTGFPFDGQLMAPVGSTVMTPLTTLLVGSGLTVAQLAELLGQPAGTDITKIDVANGQNIDLFKKTLAVHQMLDSISRLSASKSGETNLKAVYARVVSDFAKSLATQASGSTFISAAGDINSTMLSAIVRGLPDILRMNLSASDAEAAADATVNALAAEAQMFTKSTTTDLTALASLTRTLQNPARQPLDVGATTNHWALSNDSLTLNGVVARLSDLSTGATLSGLDTIGIDLRVVGNPASESVSSVALELVERGGEGRKLQLMIDEVSMKLDAQGQLQVAVPPTAKVYVYGYTTNGTEVNLTIADLSFSPIRVTNNGFTLNYDNMVRKVLTNTDASARTTAERFLAITGSFDIKVVIDKVNIRKSDSSAFTNQTVRMTNTSKSVTGAGFTGIVTVQ